MTEIVDRSDQILEVLADTFGDDDFKVRSAKKRYEEIISDGSDLSRRMGAMYLEWCVTYPSRIASRLNKKDHNCEQGWILEDPEEDRYRPCPACLPGAHDKWVGLMTGDFDDNEEEDGEFGF